MLSALHPVVRPTVIRIFVVSFCLAVFNLFLLSKPASAQGSFTTNKPFFLSVDAARHFTLTGIPVVYKPLHGSPASGFLTLSGTPDNRSLTLFSAVQLSFSPTLNGAPTVIDTFPLGTITALGTNLYCLASMGASARGNTFNLYGGLLSASSAASLSAPKATRFPAANRFPAASAKQVTPIGLHKRV